MNPHPATDYCPTQDAIYRKSNDSWWVMRHDLGPDGQALPFGRIVYFATSEQEASRWIQQSSPHTAMRQAS